MKTKFGRKILALVLAVVTVVSMFGGMITVSAAGGVSNAEIKNATYDVWDGVSVDTDWASDATLGKLITSAAELAGLAASVNGGNTHAGESFAITVNVDLGGHSWVPIGSQGTSFAGNLNGAYGGTANTAVIIKNMKISGGATAGYGLIGEHTGSKVSYITLVDAEIARSADRGAFFVGNAAGTGATYTNLISVDGTLTVEADRVRSYVGGLIGYAANTVTVDSCAIVNGEITGNIQQSGGLIGTTASGTVTVTNTYTGARVSSGQKRIGGMIGYVDGGLTVSFTNCQSAGMVGSSSAQAGSWIGRVQASENNGTTGTKVSFTNCVNTGMGAQGYDDVSHRFGWVGLLGSTGSSTTNHYITITTSNCYTNCPNIPMFPRNDGNAKLNMTVDGTSKTGSTAEGGDTLWNSKKATDVGSPSLSTTEWTLNGRKTVLNLVKNLERPYGDAKLSWFNPSSSSFTIDEESEMIGLALLSQTTAFSTAQWTYIINETNFNSALNREELFYDGFLESITVTSHTKTVGGTNVDPDMMGMAVQVREASNGNADAYDIRFVSTVNNNLSKYQNVGFEITRKDTGATTKLLTKTVYTYIAGETVKYKAEDTFSDNSAYFYAQVLTNVPKDAEFVVTPVIENVYSGTGERSYVYGQAKTICYNEILPQQSNALVNDIVNNYQIVYKDGNSGNRTVAIKLRDAIELRTGVVMPVVTDTVAASNGVKCLLIGATSLDDGGESLDSRYEILIRKGTKNGVTNDNILLRSKGNDEGKNNLIQEFIRLAWEAKDFASISWNSYIVANDNWATPSITSTAGGYLTGFYDSWKTTVSASGTYIPNSWIYDFHEKAATVTTTNGRTFSKAHRGDITNYPDGSLESIASAILAGVDAVEIDVRITADGVPVVSHDNNLNSTTNVSNFVGRTINGVTYPNSCFISDWTYAQLKSLNLVKDDTKYGKIPSLYEALELCGQRVFVQLDDKTGQLNDGTTIKASDWLYDLAKSTNSRESFFMYYGNDSSYQSWATTAAGTTEYEDKCYVVFYNWIKDKTGNLPRSTQIGWPMDNGQYSARFENGGNMMDNSTYYTKVENAGYRGIWTENPYVLCQFIQSKYSKTSYSKPSYPSAPVEGSTQIPVEGSGLDAWNKANPDTVGWSDMFPS